MQTIDDAAQTDPGGSPEAPASSIWLKPLFTSAVFVSAFLLFLIQPMFGRMALPLLGGAPSVWNTALVFYQATLLGGYAYAHWASKALARPPRIWIHVGLALLAFLALPIRLPGIGDPPTDANPVPWLLGLLAIGVGLPFFFVSTTSPLVQRWFSRTGHKQAQNPYFLYAAGNVGSLAALLLYPVVFERQLDLQVQSTVWSAGYGLLVLLLVLCAWAVGRSPSVSTVQKGDDLGPKPEAKRKWRWIALAFVPSSLSMGVTTYISTEVAAVPLLWVLPLSLYLLTFVMAFADRGRIPTRWIRPLVPFAVVLPLIVTVGQFKESRLLGIGGGILCFFVCCLFCHSELADDRPQPGRLTEFFLWVSFGGVLGGIFCGILAPLLFKQVLEYPLALALCALLVPASNWKLANLSWAALALTVGASFLCLVWLKQYDYWNEQQTWKAMLFPAALSILTAFRPVALAIGTFVVATVPLFFGPYADGRAYQARGFFGTVYVREWSDENILLHGTTIHGRQPKFPAVRDLPTSYYHETGPVGDFLVKRPLPKDARVGVVGLGVGTLLAYSRQGQEWTVYEIDPEVVKVASDRRFFSYLPNAKGQVKIVLGDARISLKRSNKLFDALLLDAYSSDAVPVHLMTLEAVETYLDRLAPGGFIAFHISNRYMDLGPVLSSIGTKLGLDVRRRDDNVMNLLLWPGKSGSHWVLLSRKASDVAPLDSDPQWIKSPATSRALWTDGRSSILDVLNGSPWFVGSD
ncbi:MAG: fused MFS/spermidine synthase [Armatimonadetes bacterium]|nr:fused MFS/spermidine synthase [Armatimonadota bacterium]